MEEGSDEEVRGSAVAKEGEKHLLYLDGQCSDQSTAAMWGSEQTVEQTCAVCCQQCEPY